MEPHKYKIRNADANEIIRQNAKLRIQSGFPSILKEECTPVMDMTPDLHRVINIVKMTTRSTTGNATMYTTPTDTNKDFFLYSLNFAYSCSALCDSVLYLLGFTPFASASAIEFINLPKQTLTATNDNIAVSFNPPIKIQPNTPIYISQSFTAGASVMYGNMTGVLVDNYIYDDGEVF